MIEKPRYLSPKVDSNDWLKPIAESAKTVFSRFLRDEAIEIAGALVKGIYGVEGNEVPWVIVFSSDNFELVLEKLKVVLRTPDGKTPTTNPKYSESIKNLRKILFDAGAASWPFSDHAACNLINVAAGESETARWYFYNDNSRKYPQYVDDWEEKLIEQFGEETVYRAIQNNSEPLDLLKQNEEIVLSHGPRSLQKEGEDTAAFFKRAFTSLNVAGSENLEESLNTATKLLETRLDGYRKAAYQLRGIPSPLNT
jgi:hypothetical protein